MASIDLKNSNIISLTKEIYGKNNAYKALDEELTEFIDSLNAEQFIKIREFIEKIPRLQKE